jgi:general secretion pathway protein K
MVLGSLAILAVLLVEFQDETSADLGHALSERDGIQAEYAARSAVNLSRLLIAAEPTIRQAVGPLMAFMGGVNQLPVWEFTDAIMGIFNDAAGAERFKTLAPLDPSHGKALGMTGAGFEVEVIDEDSKVNFNMAARGDAFSQQRLALLLLGLVGGAQYSPLFDERDHDGNFSSRLDLCSAVIDWTDPDTDGFPCDTSGQFVAVGAEDAYYQTLPDGYERKNSAFDSLEELHRVRGVSDDFWATFVEPRPFDPSSRIATVWGQGKVNVNTANAQTLLAVICGAAVEGTPLCVDSEEQAKFLSMIGMVKMMTQGAPLFSSPANFAKVVKGQGGGLIAPLIKMAGLQPVVFRLEDELLKAVATESKVFSIYATGVATSGKRRTVRRIHAVVDFRGAPMPPDPFKSVDPSTLSSDEATAAIEGAKPKAETPDGFDQASGLENAFRPDPGGRIIYYRIE